MLDDQKLIALHAAVAAVAPITGISGTQGSIRVDYDGATVAQQTAGQNVVASFDWSDTAQLARNDAAEPDLSTLRDQVQAAFDNNATYLALASPTTAQAVAQVKALTQQNQKIIKALARLIVKTL